MARHKNRTGKASADETGHRQGNKLSRQHTTSIKEAGWLVDAARKLADVTHISLGLIMPTHGGSPRLKFMPVNGGFKVTVRGRTAIQYVMVYTKDSASTQKLLEEAFLEKC